MKILFLTVALSASCFSYADVVKVNVCGTFGTTENQEFHYITVKSGDLKVGAYELFATNESGANALEAMKDGKNYCIVGGFNPNRPDEGISFASLKTK